MSLLEGPAPCEHVWVGNSGKGGAPEWRQNRQMWAGLRMHVKCELCHARTWMSQDQWKALPIAGSVQRLTRQKRRLFAREGRRLEWKRP